MTKTLTLLLASAALTAAVGLPAWSAMHSVHADEDGALLTSVFGSADGSRPVMLADNDEHDDEGGAVNRRQSDDDEEDCDEDEGSCGAAAAPAPAPAGSVPPPQNGLFGTGAPKVQVK